MNQTTHDFLRDVLAYATQRLAEVSVPDVGDEPMQVAPKEPAVSADMERAKEAAVSVNTQIGSPKLREILGTFEAKKLSDIPPPHFNHFVRLCNEALTAHANGSSGDGAALDDPLS